MAATHMRRLRRNRLSAALLTAFLMPITAAAQDSSSTQSGQAEPAAETQQSQAKDLDTVTVTGSRIGRDVFNSVSPVQVITREETTLAGFDSTTGVLQSTSVTAGSSQINNAYGGYVTDGGPGANTLSLRGLGATRTLILLNGRRVSPAGSRGSVGSADLNVLPNSMIDRIEVLKDGASSIYGSDAVAGVVNIITRKRADGVTMEAQHNATEGGGGDSSRYSIMFGSTGDNSHISGSYEYYRRNELTIGDRDWAGGCPTTMWRDIEAGDYWGSGDYIDPMTGRPKCWHLDAGGVTINTIGTNTRTGVAGPGATGTRFNRWRPNSAVTTGLVGFEGVSYDSRDTFDPDMLNESLISPVTVHTGYLQGGFDIGALGDAEVFYEVLGNKRKSSQTGYRQLSLDYAVGSPLIPANLSTSVFSPAPSELTNGRNVGVRAFIGFGNDHSKQDVEFWRALAGIRGKLGSSWNYEFGLMKSRSDADYTFESFLTDRLAQSLDVVSDGAGGFVCRNAANGCVAAPALTTATIAGDMPSAWKDWVFVPVTGNTLYEETTANFNVNGPLFDMPIGGTVQGAFGVEWREAKIDDTPNIHSINSNLYNLTSSTPTRGKDSVMEVYGEVEFPLLSGVRGAEELTFNVSGRYTDYDSYGSDTTYKIGALWTPVSWMSLRASYGTSYRAPALFEQFLGATTGFLASSNDPCNEYGEREPNTPTYVNCAAEGLPPDFSATTSVEVVTLGGAETGLSAETSKNFTVGLVFQPEFSNNFGDLSFAVDYYDIEVENGVDRAGAANILSLCYGGNDFAEDAGFCRLVSRDPGSNQLTVLNGYVNISTDIVRGLDFTTRYVRDIGPGEFRATLLLTRFLEQSSKVFQDDPLIDYNGMLQRPEYTGTLDLSYTVKNWRLRYGLEWIDGMSSYDYYARENPGLDFNPSTSMYKIYTPNYFLSSVSAQYNGDKWSVTAGVRNMFDKEPPTISQGIYNTVGNALLYSGYDYFGRTFFVNVTKSF
ncbi:TonB-dependent receptor plug domain-containing protein [Vulcaniibacterium tengchongense]|uniref:TonB-dependent receptor-like protein n=1 Tax=Vulcaniibacterium tengchongense TaxID=1273429 RepID=A0A3N4VEF8_9GAMM|nr:TonB-dependent receptor [Vulcaniibacterium tengchongense]RPE81372.1 TonB-dependent receptor-like protein [Vulcaniibacterium tengchongense]